MVNSMADVEAAGRGRRRVRWKYDWTATEPSTAVVEALADLKGVDPLALVTGEEMVLSEYIDPAALNALVTDRPGDGINITVDIDGYTARITDDVVVVEQTTEDADNSE